MDRAYYSLHQAGGVPPSRPTSSSAQGATPDGAVPREGSGPHGYERTGDEDRADPPRDSGGVIYTAMIISGMGFLLPYNRWE